MLDSIAIRTVAPFRTRLDIGEIVEAMLFYGRVDLYLVAADLEWLARKYGVGSLLAFVESGFVRVTLLREFSAVNSSGVAWSPTYDFVIGERAPNRNRQFTRLEIVKDAFQRATNSSGASRDAAVRFLNSASVSSLNDGVDPKVGVCGLTRRDVADPDYTREAMRQILGELAGRPFEGPWKFEIRPSRGGYRVISEGINYPALTARHQDAHGPNAGEITPALLLDFLHTARVDLALAARAETDILTSPITSSLIALLMRVPSQKAAKEQKGIADFQEVVLEGRSVGEAVRAGTKTLDDVLRVVEASRRFREWLDDKPADASLLAEYVKAISRDSWIDSLPGKHYRWALMTAVGAAVDVAVPGIAGTLAGAALATADAFFLDPLLHSWRPNHFIDRDLRPFLAS